MSARERNFNFVCVVVYYVFTFWAIKYILYIYMCEVSMIIHLFQINTINYSCIIYSFLYIHLQQYY